MPDLLDLSSRIIDQQEDAKPALINPTDMQLSVLGDNIAMVAGFSHMVVFDTGDGLVTFDTSMPQMAKHMISNLRHWRPDPVNSVVYTHGHFDHVGGMGAFIEEAQVKGHAKPRVLGHENVAHRMHRYEYTEGYNGCINDRQFGVKPTPGGKRPSFAGTKGRAFGPEKWIEPDVVVQDHLTETIGNTKFELHHAIGETDDHLWGWVDQHKAIISGDFIIWAFPNAGNPQKVQRYPLQWAQTLRTMALKEPELLLPAHGLPVRGVKRIATLLDDVATALEFLVEKTIAMMNQGATLDDIIHSVKLPKESLEKAYMRPTYDEPEFIVHNIWRLYGGWYEGDPAHLKPAPKSVYATEIAALAGGVDRLAQRAEQLSQQGEHRMACHLIEIAAQAEPTNLDLHRVRSEVYMTRRGTELSRMAKGIYGAAVVDSQAVIDNANLIKGDTHE